MDTYSHDLPHIQNEVFGRLGKRLKGPCKRPPSPYCGQIAVKRQSWPGKRVNVKSKTPRFAGISLARSAGLEPATF
jgi:hypothetical protein